MTLHRLAFAALRDTNPDRYEKADLLASTIHEHDPGEFVVRRDGADHSHPCRLVRAFDHAWGRCECDGFEFHDGPCSHLCLLWRAHQRDLLDVPQARVNAVSVDIETAQQALADHVDKAPSAVPDGGERR